MGTNDNIVVEIGGATLSIPPRVIAKALLEKLMASAVQASAGMPRVGESWEDHGGVYAGVVRGDEGKPDYYLVLADWADKENATWEEAKTWAASLKDTDNGLTDYTLPTRREQSILYANTKEHFKDAWYWSGEQYAGTSGYAWGQYFDDGYQGLVLKGGRYRARAVRRVPIQ